MRNVLLTAVVMWTVTAAEAPALADQQPATTISVSATGYADSTPDIAKLTLGVHVQDSSATSVVSSLTTTAQAVRAALHSVGIADADIKIANESINQQPEQGPAAAPASYMGYVGFYVRTTADQVGAVIDAAVAAGANQTYGIVFDSSQRDALYRQALAQALESARAQAEALAKAAHLTITGIQSISTGPGAASPYSMSMPPMTAGPPIQGSIYAVVNVVFKVK